MNDLTTRCDTSSLSTVSTVDYQGVAHVKSYGMTEYARRFITGENIVGQSASGPPQPYKQSVWVYRCIKLLADLVCGLPMVLTDKGENVIESGTVFDWWRDPNNTAGMTLPDFLRQTVGWGELSGERHWLLDGKGKAFRIEYVAGKSHLKRIPEDVNKPLAGWRLQVGSNSRLYALDEVVSQVQWSPYEADRGLSPLDAAALSVSQDWQASTYNNSRLQNGAEPGGLLYEDNNPSMMDEVQAAQVLQGWNSRQQGAKMAGKAGILYGGLKWQQVASSYSDMQFTDLRKMSRDEILAVWLVPKVLLGLSEDANYGYADSQLEMFWNNTMRFLCLDINSMLDRITKRLDANLTATLDIESAPIYAKLYAAKLEQAKELMDRGVPFNEVNQKLDLGYEDTEWGDHWWINRNLVPAQDVLDGVVAAQDEAKLQAQQDRLQDANAGDKPKKSTKAAEVKWTERDKVKTWRAWVKSWGGMERGFRQTMRNHFRTVERDILAHLSPPKLLKDPTTNLNELFTDADRKKWNEHLRDVANKHFDKATTFGMAQGADEVDANAAQLFGEADPRLEAMKKIKTVKIVEVNETVRRGIEKKVRAAMVESAQEGETIQQLTDRIKEAIKTSCKQARTRALTIARTETGQCVSMGRHRAFERAKVQTRRWISARVNTRESHLQAEQRYGETGIPLGEKYMVGGYALAHPCDPSGPPQEIINCRCLEVPGRLAGGRAIDPAHYETKGFLTWQTYQSSIAPPSPS